MNIVTSILTYSEWLLLGITIVFSPKIVRWFKKQNKECALTDAYFSLEENHMETLRRAVLHDQLNELDCSATPGQLLSLVQTLRCRDDRRQLIANWHLLYLKGKEECLRHRLTH